ncbi:MAG: LamB/YcsF family protein [Sulfobacillus thermotolerans]|uniref:5-oxoprolinase subunit A n=1 Tax=Sulfobacillus thermotolerans TaxID=338644 RepID=A0ABM6RVG3_9FIRM|nr:lactam utilization protein LamB [Sulfobacillus thermotolerans]MCY0909272.1 LamB/YcsF family protein [Sulfobacillus thermotolerans]
MRETIDINCDMGESFGVYHLGDDAGIMPFITSANVACGFHAGDPQVMQRTVALAKTHGVAVGAHPSFPDLVGFGRRNMTLTYEEAYADVLYQIGSLYGVAKSQGLSLQHVKPHGQLNNMAVTDAQLAQAIVDAIWAFDPSLIVIAYGGELMRAAEARGLRVAHEVYADREYLDNGQLVPRSYSHAVIHDVERIVARAVQMVKDQAIPTVSGQHLPVQVDTICVHGDTPGARSIAQALREGLEDAKIMVRTLATTAAL